MGHLTNKLSSSGGSREGSGGLLEHPFETKFFHFHGDFLEKKSSKIINNQVKSTNHTILCKFELPTKKSWIRPCLRVLHQK